MAEEKTDGNGEKKNGLEDLRREIDSMAAKMENVGLTVNSLQAQVTQPPVENKPAHQEVTNSEIRAAVDAGTISEEQADEIRMGNIRRRVEEDVQRDLEVKDRLSRIGQEMIRYKQAYPDILNTNSETFQRVQREFSVLIDIGMDPKDPKTELAAVRSALGTPDAPKRTGTARQPYMEVGGGMEGASGEAGEGPPSWVKGELRSFYEKMIANGQYSGWDDKNVKKELDLYADKFKAAAA